MLENLILYLIAGVAIMGPVLLVVKARSGKAKMQCCAGAPEGDLRMRPAFTEDTPEAG